MDTKRPEQMHSGWQAARNIFLFLALMIALVVAAKIFGP